MSELKRTTEPSAADRRLLKLKLAAVRRDRAQLAKLEKNVKHLAKELGITLT